MGSAIGESLAAAVGVALSPLPIIACVLVVVSPRGRVNGPLYLCGQILGVATVGLVVLLLAGAAGSGDDDEVSGSRSWLPLVVGVALLLMALRQWRGRPRDGDEVALPAWMGAIDAFGPGKALAAGFALSAFNPKNILLTIGGMASIVAAGVSSGEELVALAVFVLIGSLGVAAPVVIAFALGDRADATLARLRTWLTRNSAAIVAAILVLIAAKLIGDAIAGFTS